MFFCDRPIQRPSTRRSLFQRAAKTLPLGLRWLSIPKSRWKIFSRTSPYKVCTGCNRQYKGPGRRRLFRRAHKPTLPWESSIIIGKREEAAHSADSPTAPRMTARRLALGVLSLVAGAEAAPWTYAPINCAWPQYSSLACCTDAAIDCCSWSGDTDGASNMR